MTRDPGGFDPSRVAPNTIFLETLIHDFDTLRFLNPGANAVEVFATATALVEPEWKDRGLLDTAVVVVRFDNGAVGTAEACFEAAYGYDVRGEVFGSGGMATMGDGRKTGMVFSGAAGQLADTARGDQELLTGAYIAELAAFVDAVRTGGAATGQRRRRPRGAGDRAGRRAVGRDRPPGADRGAGQMSFRLAVSAEMVFTDLPFLERVRRIDELGYEVEIWDWTKKDIAALVNTGATFSSMTGYITGTLADPDGAAELLRTAEQSLKVAEQLNCPRLNVHGTGLDDKGLPVIPTDVVSPAMWLTAARTLSQSRRTRRTGRPGLHPGEPEHRRRPPAEPRSPRPRTPWRWSRRSTIPISE